MGPQGTTPSIDVATAAGRIDSGGSGSLGALLVDVRERDEMAEVRVPGAVLLPLSGFADTFEKLPRERPLYLMCASGRRSLVAADHLLRHGWKDVTNVTGGIIAWRNAGLPVTSGPLADGEGEPPKE